MAKPQERPNTLSFQGSFDKEQFRLTGSHYTLAPLAALRHRGQPLQGARQRRAEDQPVFQPPRSRRCCRRPPEVPARRASCRPRCRARGRPGRPRLGRRGRPGRAVSFKPGEKIKPVTGVNGSLRFNGDSLESSQLSVRLGSSSISGRGTLTGFKSPTVSLSFASPLLDLADLGLPPGKAPLRAEQVQGTLSLQGTTTCRSARSPAQLGKSALQVKGSVQDLQHPKIDLSVTSPHLELEDLTPLFGAPRRGAEQPLQPEGAPERGRGKSAGHPVPAAQVHGHAGGQDPLPAAAGVRQPGRRGDPARCAWTSAPGRRATRSTATCSGSPRTGSCTPSG